MIIASFTSSMLEAVLIVLCKSECHVSAAAAVEIDRLVRFSLQFDVSSFGHREYNEEVNQIIIHLLKI